MFTFIGPIHLVILTHRHHNNIHNNIENNNGNNTVSATHTYAKKSVFILPTSAEMLLYATILYPSLQAIYTIQKVTLCNNFL